MKILCFLLPVCLLGSDLDDDHSAPVSRGMVSCDLNNVRGVEYELDRVRKNIQSRQKEVGQLVHKSNARKIQAPQAMLRDAKTIQTRVEDRKKDLKNVTKGAEALLEVAEIWRLQSEGLREKARKLRAGEKIAVDSSSKEIPDDSGALAKATVLLRGLNIGELLRPVDCSEAQHYRGISNLPGTKNVQRLAQAKFQEQMSLAQEQMGLARSISASSSASAAAPAAISVASELIATVSAALPVMSQVVVAPVAPSATAAAGDGAAAEAATIAPAFRRPVGTEKLGDDDFLRYTTLQKELRNLRRRESLLSKLFQGFLRKESAQKASAVEATKPVSKAEASRRGKGRKSGVRQELEDLEAIAQFEQEQRSARLEVAEKREEKAAIRALKAQQVAEAQEALALQAAQENAAAAAPAEPQVPYFAESFETEAFSQAFQLISQRKQLALEDVISDIMFTGSTHRSRGLLQGVTCQVNGTPVRVDHADYFGAKDRLFYAVYRGTLVLLQVEGHDFDPKNGTVRIER